MRLTFTYADTTDLAKWKEYEPVLVPFQLPEQALQLHNCREIILDIAQSVKMLTEGIVYVTCKELALKNYSIKTEHTDKIYNAEHSFRHLVLHFVQYSNYRVFRFRDLRILLPIAPEGRVPDYFWRSSYGSRRDKDRAAKRWNKLSDWNPQTPASIEYSSWISTIADNCLLLLNTEPPPNNNVQPWTFEGFHPLHKQAAAIDRLNRRQKERAAERRKQEKEVEKQCVREEKLAQKQAERAANGLSTPTEVPKTGGGRRVGAVPGMFKNVMFRSQLEIRFVTQLEAKGIRWVYEGERLGEGQYLVDFYLPDLKCWVEVKGRIEPRDDYLLKDVADYLKRERTERIFVYTQSKAYKISSRAFTELTHPELWAALEKV